MLNRETKRYEDLKPMFSSENEKDSTKRFERLSNVFADPLTEVHVAFFTVALPIFTNKKQIFAKEWPCPKQGFAHAKSRCSYDCRKVISRDKLKLDITVYLIDIKMYH